MKIKSILKMLVASALLATGLQAHALALTPSSLGMIEGSSLTPPTGPANCEPDCVNLAFPSASDPLELLYKADVGSADSGTFAGSYNTTFANTPTDPMDATIAYISGPTISCPECYLVIKDGNATPSYYFYDLSAWNGTDSIVMTGFWPGSGAISHVSIWGADDVPFLPEPAMLGLMGLGLVGIAAARRRRTA